MLDPRLRLPFAAPAALPLFLQQPIQTLMGRLRSGWRSARRESGLWWREGRMQLQREVWLPLKGVCRPAVIGLKREAAALCLTTLALWQEGRAHLHNEARALRRAIRCLVREHPAWPLWRKYSQRLRERLAEMTCRMRALAVQSGLEIAGKVAQCMPYVRSAALTPRVAATLYAARHFVQEQLTSLGQLPAYVNAISVMVIATYLSLALMSLAIVAFALPPVPPLAEPVSRRQANAYLGQRKVSEGQAALTPTASPTPSPAPAFKPTATPAPVLTATPIPIVYSVWESTLPQHGGWNGAGQCWGPVLAPLGTGTFIWPTDRHYLVGKDFSWRWHPGLDLGGEFDEPIYAADSGVVVYAGWNTYGYGNLIILDHGNGWHTLYAHFNAVLVGCGEAVTQGQLIGLAGSTGRSTGPHLHFEMRLGGNYVNPWEYLPPP